MSLNVSSTSLERNESLFLVPDFEINQQFKKISELDCFCQVYHECENSYCLLAM